MTDFEAERLSERLFSLRLHETIEEMIGHVAQVDATVEGVRKIIRCNSYFHWVPCSKTGQINLFSQF